MGTVIYSASPLQAMSGSLAAIGLMLGLGVVGIGAAFLQKSQSKGARMAMGIAGGFLILVSLITAAFTFTSISSGAETVTVRLNEKNIVQESCGDDGDTCTRYILETNAGDTYYDFVVSSQAFDLAQVNACYRVTITPANPLSTQRLMHIRISASNRSRASRLRIRPPVGDGRRVDVRCGEGYARAVSRSTL